ncbi:MAG: hypothetical protein IJM15_07465 [Erysipelotrichaceae bacterium]|nr:hypothetical protein [Erysipelotrichaceae bacterium]
MIWKLIKKTDINQKNKHRIFLLINTVLCAAIGFVIWLAGGRNLFGNRWDWMICFIGYPGFFAGYLGGIFFLLNND